MRRLQRFIELSKRHSPLAIANTRSGSRRKSHRRRAMRGMKKASITRAESSHDAGRQGEKPTVGLSPPQPPLIISQAAPVSLENSNPLCSPKVTSSENRGGDILTEARGSCSKVGEKRKISRLQEAKENLKRMKVEVKNKRAETNLMMQGLMEETTKFQAAAEGFESALAQGRAQNELMMMVQNLQDQFLFMLSWSFILDADDSPIHWDFPL